MDKFKSLYEKEYFSNRNQTDLKRIASFQSEKIFLEKYIDFNGAVCDIGCSTGEFLTEIGWTGPKFGMEISEHAIKIAELSGIDFSKNIETETSFFDVVLFRGTIQHLPYPIKFIDLANNSLKPGGKIVFLATPNANSIVYKLTNTLPMISPKFNFYIPSDVTLINICENFGFDFVDIQKPYWHSPYRNLLMDHIRFIRTLLTGKSPNFAFWNNMMNVILIKKN